MTSFTHRPCVLLARFSFCWWRHTRLMMTSQWPDNCGAITRITIFNSLDIDFIRCDIYGRSCKRNVYMIIAISLWKFPGDTGYHFTYVTACFRWIYVFMCVRANNLIHRCPMIDFDLHVKVTTLKMSMIKTVIIARSKCYMRNGEAHKLYLEKS